MKAKNSRLTPAAVGALVALAVFSVSCDEVDQPVAPDFAAGGRGLTVTSVVPDTAERGITLDVTVNGSGFDQGSAVGFERQGAPATAITTNSTTFVTNKKLIANITIAADADTGKYDVAVTTSGGRKGVGIELLTVVYQLDELGVLGGTWSRANSINDLGEVVGESCTQSCLGSAFYWTDGGGLVDLGTLPGYSRSGAFAINDLGQVFGQVVCRAIDPGCGNIDKEALVRWDRVGGNWTITALQGCSLSNERFPINNNGQCVRQDWISPSVSTLSIQTLSGGAVVNEEPLPSLFPGGTNTASSINDAAMVAGSARSSSSAGSPSVPVVWYRHASGAWLILQLVFPSGDYTGSALDISEPDASGRVWVSGYSAGARDRGGYQAVRWMLSSDGSGGLQVASTEALPRKNGTSDAWGRAITSGGDVVGHSGFSPVKWPVTGGIEILPTLRGSGEGRAMDISGQGWIVGAIWDRSNGCDRAGIWRLM